MRVIDFYTGGAFSGRVGPRNHHFIAALLSRRASRPVKLRCTADEEFIVCQAGAHYEYKFKTGVMKDGTLKAVDADFLFDCGAYLIPMLKGWLQNNLHFLSMFYKCDAARLSGKFVYTNNPSPRFHHGASVLGLKFVMEAELDHIARDLGIDPVALRLKNAVETGDTTIGNLQFGSCGLKECIQKASDESGWQKKYGKLPPYKGIGIGCGGIFSGGKIYFKHDTSAIFVKIGGDGKVFLLTGLPELGQGGHTALAMIAAETLGIELEDLC